MNTRNLYVISFIEGGAVMVTELAGAKLLSPFFGASIYSWAATLSITLLALMAGYYAGGHLTTKPKFRPAGTIAWIFLLSGVFVMLMPSLATYIMTETVTFSYFSGLLISELIFLFTPIFLMATISPMIIYQITKKAEDSGKQAGSIYALSTSGGIFFTLLFGFFIIPEAGISSPVRILGLLICLIAIALLIYRKMTAQKIAAGVGVLFLAVSVFANHPELPSLAKLTVVEKSEGLLGELRIIDQNGVAPDGSPLKLRSLRTNNVPQNLVAAEKPSQSFLYYVNFVKQLVNIFPEKKSALLVGLGAGSLYKVLSDQYKEVVSVELDQRIYDYGVQYFGMAEHDNVVDDGRHYINTCNKKFDLIMIDVIVGENVPEQMVTLENFKKCHDLLNENGILVIENGSVYDISHNSFIPSLIKTMKAAGFQISVFNPLRSQDHGDIVFIASKKKFYYSDIALKDDIMIKGGPLSDFALDVNIFDRTNETLLTDEKNYTDMLLKSHYLAVRKALREDLSTEIAYINFSTQSSN